jgi:hypothetical protein
MSKQLAVASAFSIFALSALALFPPSQADSHGFAQRTGATIEIAAPAFSAYWPLID